MPLTRDDSTINIVLINIIIIVIIIIVVNMQPTDVALSYLKLLLLVGWLFQYEARIDGVADETVTSDQSHGH